MVLTTVMIEGRTAQFIDSLGGRDLTALALIGCSDENITMATEGSAYDIYRAAMQVVIAIIRTSDEPEKVAKNAANDILRYGNEIMEGEEELRASRVPE